MIDLAYHHNKRLVRWNFNLERSLRIGAEARVSNPVGADVVRIEAPQVSGGEDEVDAGARCVGIDRDTLGRAAWVRERVRIVTVQQLVASDLTRRARRTSLRNTAFVQVINLRRIV